MKVSPADSLKRTSGYLNLKMKTEVGVLKLQQDIERLSLSFIPRLEVKITSFRNILKDHYYTREESSTSEYWLSSITKRIFGCTSLVTSGRVLQSTHLIIRVSLFT